MTRLVLRIAAILCLAAAAASLLPAQPRTDPSLEAGVVNRVTNFITDHPEWAVLRDGRDDLATINLTHRTHMNPAAHRMQQLITKAGEAIPAVATGPDGVRTLTCASCHEADDAGRYMKPIRFERHCASCHVPDFPVIEGRPVPHGDVPALVDRVQRAAGSDYAAMSAAHALHLNPDVSRMQDLLAADQGAGRIPGVATDAAGKRTLTCSSCHTAKDDQGAMKSVSYKAHCASCHVQEPASFRISATATENAAAWFASASIESWPGADVWQPGAGLLASASFAVRTVQPRRDKVYAPEGHKTFVGANDWINRRQVTDFARIRGTCVRCHAKESITAPSPDRPGEPFDVAPPMIPDRWLERSIFSHRAHRALTCLECHEGAQGGTRAADIMLPSIESCRKCHTPAVGVRSDCVLCHVYHRPIKPGPPGTITIEQYSGASAEP